MGAPFIFIAGPHRSGTSALASALSHLGFDMGGELVPPAADNPGGFWENQAMVQADEGLLERLGLDWDDWGPLAHDAWNDESVRAHARTCAAILEEFGEGPCAAKDPRLSRVLPAWREATRDAGYEAKCIIATRHPIAVAASLAARNGMSLEDGLMLWWTYTSEAIWNAAGLPTVAIRFEDLLADPDGTVSQALADLDVQAPGIVDLSTVIDRKMVHHDDGGGVHGRIPDLIREACIRLWNAIREDPDGAADEAWAWLDARLADADVPTLTGTAGRWDDFPHVSSHWDRRQRASTRAALRVRDAVIAEHVAAIRDRDARLHAANDLLRGLGARGDEALGVAELKAERNALEAELREAKNAMQKQGAAFEEQLARARDQRAAAQRRLEADEAALADALARATVTEAEAHQLQAAHRRLVVELAQAADEASRLEEKRAVLIDHIARLERELQALRAPSWRRWLGRVA